MTKDELDMVEFEKTQLRLQYESVCRALGKKYRQAVDLELAGIEDIIEFLPDNAKPAVRERCSRMRKAVNEITTDWRKSV